MLSSLVKDLHVNRKRIITEMSRSGLSVTANRIIKMNGYSPRGNMLYVPGVNQEYSEVKSEIWHAAFVESEIKEPFPRGYDGSEVRIQTEGDEVLKFMLVYRKNAMIDPDGHLGVLPHIEDLESVDEFATHYNVKSVITPPNIFKDFIEGLDVTGI